MARHFDGTSDHIEIADHAALTWPADVSIGGWIRVDSGDTSATIHGLMTWGGYAATPSFTAWCFGPNHASANKILFQTKDDDGNLSQITSNSVIGSPGTWHHVALTIEDSPTWNRLYRLYIDGVEDSVADFKDFSGANVAAVWKIGDTQGGPVTGHFYGDMAEWAKWDSALSTEQITALANGVRPPEVGTRPAWYMPMLAGLEEEIAGLAATNNGTTIAEHPPKIVAAGQYI